MNLCAFQKSNDETSFIDIYNWGDYIIRYNGIYYSGGFPSRFCTLPIFPLDNIKTTFPDDATGLDVMVQRWSDSTSMWGHLATIFKVLPGQFCYRSAGTFLKPRFDEILCP